MILFRLDAYPDVGMGHIIRSISIAKQLIKIDGGIEILFVGCFNDDATELINAEQIHFYNIDSISNEVQFINEQINKYKPEIVYIDKLYKYTRDSILDMRKHTKIIMMHNLCEGAFFVNSFILPSAHTPQNIIVNPKWKNNNISFYFGPDYIPVNEHVVRIKNTPFKEISKKKLKVAILTGGSDPKGVLIKILDWIKSDNFSNVEFVAFKGKSFVHKKELAAIKSVLTSNIKVVDYNMNNIAKCDLAICTFGVSTYELIYLGIPTLSVGHQESNAVASKNLSEMHKIVVDIGCVDNLNKRSFIGKLKEFIRNETLHSEIKKKSRRFIDGKGAERIAKVILTSYENE